MRKIGIYPGTFDPIHSGHIAFSKQALTVCGLDQIIFLPETRPRAKPSASAVDMRLPLITTAITDDDTLGVFLPSSSPFTVNETLPEIFEQFKGSNLTLLLGSDVIKKSLYQWHNLEILLQSTSLAIGLRQRDTAKEIHEIMQRIAVHHHAAVQYTIIQTAHADMSSTKLRQATA